MSPYKARCHKQLEGWLEGRSIHNRVDDECCPDFSCCVPELYHQDRAVRLKIYNQFAEANGLPKKLDS
jgi:hypothetical protein